MAKSKQRLAAKDFAKYWENRGRERGDSQPFWISLLRDVLGIEHPEQFITFEEEVKSDNTYFIDARIDSTRVLIEQKSSNKELDTPTKQSNGTYLSPFKQAQRYRAELPYSKQPRWIVICNFQEFHIYDMNRIGEEPQKILLKDLEKEYYRLSFLVDVGNEHLKKEIEVSTEAGEIVGLLYDALLKQYIDKTRDETLKSLNILCVRLVFCLYAEDAGVFIRNEEDHNMFYDYMKQYDVPKMRKALISLFEVLNTKQEDRDPYLEEDLKAFPYVNGGLFAKTNIVIPQFTEATRDLLLEKASAKFDWSKISPTIFGAVFESTLNPETRREGGMHYTSIENIHKVIDPLFMDELNEEFEKIKALPKGETRDKTLRKKKLGEIQNKIADLNFLDPACGSGNFLTETYISLRKLENEILKELYGLDRFFGELLNPIKVSIKQFYGIEINDFAVTVAKTALWIAESQMMKETIDIVHRDLDFLPLETCAEIIEGNALRVDWKKIISQRKLNYIMGNPPFVGARVMSTEQKEDISFVFGGKWKNIGNIDYVSGWYKKAADVMQGTNICTALVSTNSITQGEQVPILWRPLFEQGVHIDFAYRTFRWNSESNSKAHVYCVIVGFSYSKNNGKRKLYSGKKFSLVDNINAYLIDAENIFIDSRPKPISSVPKIGIGNQPIDGSNYLFSEDEMKKFVKQEPLSEQYFRPWFGAKEFINGKPRFCLWLGDCPPDELCKMRHCLQRVENVRNFRLNSKRAETRKLAANPTRFQVENMPSTEYIIIPRISSEKRKYIPIGFLDTENLCSDSVHIIPKGTLYHFGILTSNVHMAWIKIVCGRLGMSYRYSENVVYNNFPWCNPTDEQKAKIEKTAQGILDERESFPKCSLADLYNELTMPPNLKKAHQKNDEAVMEAYGFRIADETTGKPRWLTEYEIVAKLMKMYQNIVSRKKHRKK